MKKTERDFERMNDTELEKVLGGAAGAHRGNGVILVDAEKPKDDPDGDRYHEIPHVSGDDVC